MVRCLGISVFFSAIALSGLAACAQRPAAAQAVTSRPSPTCAAQPRDTSWVIINATLPQPAPSVIDSARVVLVRQGFVLTPASSALRLQTAPRFTWPEGTEAETWHGEENPGVRVVISAEPRSADSAAVSIAARAVCAVAAPGSTVPSDEVGETLQMITALQVANALSKPRGR